MNVNKKINETEKRHFRNDAVLIVSALLLSCLVLVCMLVCGKRGSYVRVTVDGKDYGVYSLSEDAEYEICTGESLEERNLLVIENGKAFVREATCPDGICTSHPPVSRDGQTIICLPHRVVVTVIEDVSENDVDVAV